jgi:fatty-acyl-CoA synthase
MIKKEFEMQEVTKAGWFRPADFATLTEALDYAAQGRQGFNFYSGRGELQEALSYFDLRRAALDLAGRMLKTGLQAGERIALIAETDGDFVRAFFACQYAGLVPVPMPLPVAFGGAQGYVSHIRRMMESSGASALLYPAMLESMMLQASEGLPLKVAGTLRAFDAFSGEEMELPEISPGQLSYLQYSSGSTRFPLGVAVTQQALLSNCRAITRHGLKTTPHDRCMSWLPFYHDMGLVGFLLTPLTTQISVDYVATREFARRPLIWPTLISRHGASLSFSPSFGYDLCARRATSAALAGLDLSRWRVAGIGGDMIRPQVMADFAARFAGNGFRRESFVASFGMAEATLAISFAPLSTGIETDTVSLDLLEDAGVASPALNHDTGNGAVAQRSRSFVLCGPVLPEHEMEIRNSDGVALGERQVGRLFVRGPSLMREYFGNPEETSQTLSPDGWLDTGDLGYLIKGQLVITGRAKDLILINGRNIWPQDLEWAVEHEVAGLRSGDVAAFSLDGGVSEQVVVLVQCRKTDPAGRAELRQAVSEALRASAGLDCEVRLVAPHSLPQTSSGKLSRTKARQIYQAGGYDEADSTVSVAIDGALPRRAAASRS